MKSQVLRDREKKYLFNTNIFDEAESQNDLPPVFSQQDLDEAKRIAFHEGESAGIRKMKDSREQAVSETLKKLTQELQRISEAEKTRRQVFELETIDLTLQILRKLFPFYNEREGFEELKKALSAVIADRSENDGLRVRICSSMAEETRSFIAQAGFGEAKDILIKEDETLPEGAFVLSWADGGARRDSRELAEQIESLMKNVLSDNNTGTVDLASGPSKSGAVEKPDERQ